MEPKRLSDLLPSKMKEHSLKPLLTEQGGQNTKEISVYSGQTADTKTVATELRKLKAAFPAIENEYINVLSERIHANAFTEERIKDAVGNLIDNFKYPRPSIADVISFDKRVRLFSYSEYTNEILTKKAFGNDFIKHWIGDTLFWVKETECIRYNFKPNNIKP